MSNVPSSALVAIVGAIAAVCMVSFVYASVNSGATNVSEKKSANVNNQIAEGSLVSLDGTKVSGSEVVGYIDALEGTNISVLVNNGFSTQEYVNAYNILDDTAIAIANERELVALAQDNSSEYYIAPKQTYNASILRDGSGGEIAQIQFVVEGASTSASASTINSETGATGHIEDYRRSITLHPNYPAGSSGALSILTVEKETGSATFPDQTLPSITYGGYTFRGWKYGGSIYNGTLPGTVIDSAGGNIDLFGTWEKTTNRIMYVLNGGQVNGSTDNITEMANVGDDYTIDKLPTRAGYTFAGYATSAGGNAHYHYGDTITVKSDVALYAIWSSDTVTVTFNLNGGSGTMTSQQFIPGKARNLREVDSSVKHLDEKIDGVLYHYTFRGWSTTSDGTGDFYEDGESATFTADTTLYAIWNAVSDSFQLSYDLDGGQGNTKTETASYPHGSITLAPAPTKEDFVFQGWLIDGSLYPAGSKFYLEEDTTAKAVWYNSAPRSYSLTVYSIDENGVEKKVKQYESVVYGPSIGWEDLSAHIGKTNTVGYEGVVMHSGDKEILMPKTITADDVEYTISDTMSIPIKKDGTTKLTVYIRPITYHITYDLNQGSSNKSPEHTGDYPSTYTIASSRITIENPTMEGWRFVGWTVTGSAKKVDYTTAPAAKNSINSSTPQKNYVLKKNTFGDLTLTANWEKDVTLTLYSGTNKEKKDVLTATVTSTQSSHDFALTDITPQEISGFTAIGWRNDTSADSQKWNLTGNYTVDGSGDQTNWTIYSVYSRTATYYSGSNKSTTTTATQYYSSANNYSVTTPSAPTAISDWTAIGWRSDTNTSSAQYSTTGTITASAQVYYAIYSQSVTLSYSGNGNTGGSTASHTATRLYNTNGATYNPTLNLKSNGFTKTNYHFTKWDLGAVGTAITMNGNKTAKAQWAINTYALTVSGAGSNGITADVYIGGSKVATNVMTFSKTYNHGTSWKIVFHRSGYKDQTFSGTLTAAKTQAPSGAWVALNQSVKVDKNVLTVTIKGRFNAKDLYSYPNRTTSGKGEMSSEEARDMERNMVDGDLYLIANINGAIGNYVNKADIGDNYFEQSLRSTHHYQRENSRRYSYTYYDVDRFVSFGSSGSSQTRNIGTTTISTATYNKEKDKWEDHYEKLFDFCTVTTDYGTKNRGQECTITIKMWNPHPNLTSFSISIFEYGIYNMSGKRSDYFRSSRDDRDEDDHSAAYGDTYDYNNNSFTNKSDLVNLQTFVQQAYQNRTDDGVPTLLSADYGNNVIIYSDSTTKSDVIKSVSDSIVVWKTGNTKQTKTESWDRTVYYTWHEAYLNQAKTQIGWYRTIQKTVWKD